MHRDMRKMAHRVLSVKLKQAANAVTGTQWYAVIAPQL